MKTKNPNRPKKGSTIKVGPIRDREKIKAIKAMLKSRNPMHYALFTVGINTNLRASDLVRITANQVRNLKPMDSIEIKEQKTGKFKRFNLNKDCTNAIGDLLKTRDYKDSDPVFWGQRGPITTISIHALVKKWCKDVGLTGNYGSHTLRKTWGYHQRVTHGAGIPELMVAFNHSSQRITLDYLGVQPDEVKNLYANRI